MNFEKLRENMVKEQIIKRGIRDPGVIKAMRKVPRHEFVSGKEMMNAYEDCPISIGEGQTISQPFMAALMTQCLKLKKEDNILEIGTGSGYQTAVLAEVSKEVYTIERIQKLFLGAQKILHDLGYANIIFREGDGTLGWAEEELLFDGIIVTAGSSSALVERLSQELKEGGRLVVPLGDRLAQELTVFTKISKQLKEEKICRCIFVPLIGRFGLN